VSELYIFRIEKGKMKKKMAGLAVLVVSLLLVMSTLTLNIQPIKANPGCVTITVLFSGSNPVEHAWVRVKNLSSGAWRTLGYTNESGQVEDCSGWFTEGSYRAYAYYPDTATLFSTSNFYVDSNGDGNATVIGTYELTPPVIDILSPENKTYATSSVPLTFTVNDYSPISWMGYSLDNQPNATITGNTTLSDLALGTHDITVYANDTYGNMGSSNKVYFTRTYGCVTIKVQYADGYPRSYAMVLWRNTTEWRPFGTTNGSGITVRCSFLAPGFYQASAWYPDLATQFGEDRNLHVDENGNGNVTITAPYEVGNVTIAVQYADSYPRSNAMVRKIDPPPSYGLGNTNKTGQINCALDPGNYLIDAWYDGSQFGHNTPLYVDENGAGSATITADFGAPCVTVNVQYADGYPRSGADVYVIWPTEDWLGLTDDDGKVTRYDYLDPGEYYLRAFYGGSRFGPEEVYLYVNATGHGSATITADYPAPLVTITVRYLDGCPTVGADVWVVDVTFFGTTNSSGKTTQCGLLPQGNYWIEVIVDGSKFADGDLVVDENGRGNRTLFGAYEITSPVIEVLSPRNMSYLDSSVPLNFTIYDFSSISWIGYSLDNEANVTISGNTTLTDLALGSHSVIVYANDTFGNTGSSNRIHFTIANDVAVTSVIPSKTVVGQGYSISINVTVENQGAFTATLNVTAHANTTTIQTKETTLPSGNSTTLIFTWNTSNFPKGNYTISAVADTVLGETDTTDNAHTNGWVIVAMVGDITGPDGYPDGKCDMRDIGRVARLFGVNHPDSRYDPNCDVVYDLKIDMKDIGVVAKQFGKTDP